MTDTQLICVAVMLGGLSIMACAVLWRLYTLWRDELSFWREKAARTHSYYDNMRRAGINAERSLTN